MSAPTSALVKGHRLLFEGRTSNDRWRHTATGVGRCSCGGISHELTSDAARKRWHREHKGAVLAAEQEERTAAMKEAGL